MGLGFESKCNFKSGHVGGSIPTFTSTWNDNYVCLLGCQIMCQENSLAHSNNHVMCVEILPMRHMLNNLYESGPMAILGLLQKPTPNSMNESGCLFEVVQFCSTTREFNMSIFKIQVYLSS